MKISDDGGKMVVTSEPWLIGKVFAVVFALLALSIPLILVLTIVLPTRTATIDCNRAHGTCSLGRKAVAIADVEKAEVKYQRGRKNSSSSHHLQIDLRNGEHVRVGDVAYHDDVTAGYRAAADGLNAFLASPSQPEFKTTFVAGDTDWVFLVLYGLFSPAMAWFFIKSWVSRRVELDRAAGAIRVVQKPRFGKATDVTVPLSEVTGVQLRGDRWPQVWLLTNDENHHLLSPLRSPGFKGSVQTLVREICKATSKPVSGSPDLIAYFGVG